MDEARWAIVGAQLYDGDGSPSTAADVVIKGDRIESIEAPGTIPSGTLKTLPAHGLALAPGFIDVHSHADNAPFLQDEDTSKILQGVTTEVVGNCGFSLAPGLAVRSRDISDLVRQFFPPNTPSSPSWTAYVDQVEARGCVTNYAPLVGHGTLRTGTMGAGKRVASESELHTMASLLTDAVAEGAFGLSSGLIYTPGSFAGAEELLTMARALPDGVPYATHVRGESSQVRASIDEAVAVARQGVAVHVSHLKVVGTQQWGEMEQLLEVLDSARQAGCDLRQDVYPYTAGSTMLLALLPPWVRDGGRDATLRRLDRPDAVPSLERELAQDDGLWDNLALATGWDNIVIASSASGHADGHTVADIASHRACSPVQALVDLLISEQLEATMVIHAMCESDLRAALTHRDTMIGSDGLPPGVPGRPHPRQFGTFPRVLGRLARRDGWLSSGEAIRKMTALPAAAFGLADRGRIRPNYCADLVVFDESAIIDTATYQEPNSEPTGIVNVVLGGRVVVEAGRYVGGRHGRCLLRS